MKIRWLIGVDCDGVLTDYKNYFNSQGRLFKVFNSKDSYAFHDLRKAGHIAYIVSADEEGFPILESRARAWKIDATSSRDKLGTLKNIIHENEGRFEKVCFVGNAPEDLVVIDIVDHFFAPADARLEVRQHSKVSTLRTAGGDGVMDEVLEELQKYHEPF